MPTIKHVEKDYRHQELHQDGTSNYIPSTHTGNSFIAEMVNQIVK